MSIELHSFTHTGDRVLFVRRCNSKMRSYNDFEWPKAGPVAASDWRDDNACGGGLHGWPWGIGIGIGADLTHGDVFQVVAVSPEAVRSIEFGKCKFKEGEVVLTGSLAEAMLYTCAGRIAWVRQNANGESSSSGNRSSASSSGDRSSASSSGDSSSASSSGYWSSASSSGYWSSASSSGDRSSASSSGDSSSASSSGYWSLAGVCGDDAHVDVSPSSVGAVCGNTFRWTVRVGAIVVQRWREAVEGSSEEFRYPFKLLDSVALKLADGAVVTVVRGEVQS